MGALRTSSLLVAVILAVCVKLSAEAESHWSYEGANGPSHWPGMCEDAKQQSPIDLRSSGSKESDFEALLTINYGNNFNATVTNNGHSIQINIGDRPHNIMLGGGGLNKIYTLEQIHFHWKSEHTIDGVRYPLEAHFVHFDAKQKMLADAVKVKGGIAVLGVMFHEAESQVTDIPVLNEVNIRQNESKDIKFSPKTLLPSDTTRFYRYYGSLTTPPCSESVVWTVLANSHPLSKRQITNFQRVTVDNGRILRSNYRPLQELNNRLVYYQSSPQKEVIWHNSAHSIKNSLAIIATLFIILKFI